MTNGAPTLRIYDMTDRELLAIIDDLKQPWVSSRDVAQSIWPKSAIGDTSQSCRLSVLRRLAYMRKHGLVGKHETERDRWAISPYGHLFLQVKLRANQKHALNGMQDAEMVEVMEILGRRYDEMEDGTAWVLRREWQHREYARRRR